MNNCVYRSQHFIFSVDFYQELKKFVKEMQYLPPYTTIYSYDADVDSILRETEFGAASVYLFTETPDRNEIYLILGYNKKHDNLCAFGGGAEKGETVEDTAIRETDEETNGMVCSVDVLRSLLHKKETRKLVKRSPSRKPVYIFAVDLPWSELYIDISDLGNVSKANFLNSYKTFVEENEATLPKERKENSELVLVSFTQLREEYEGYQPGQKVYLTVNLANGPHRCELRSVCVSTLRWLCNTTFPCKPLKYF